MAKRSAGAPPCCGSWRAHGPPDMSAALCPQLGLSELVRGATFNAVIMSIKEVTVVVCRRLLLALLLKRH